MGKKIKLVSNNKNLVPVDKYLPHALIRDLGNDVNKFEDVLVIFKSKKGQIGMGHTGPDLSFKFKALGRLAEDIANHIESFEFEEGEDHE